MRSAARFSHDACAALALRRRCKTRMGMFGVFGAIGDWHPILEKVAAVDQPFPVSRYAGLEDEIRCRETLARTMLDDKS
jgi:hypothetical protein